MKGLTIPVLAIALLTAACGGAARHSPSMATGAPVANLGQVNGGADAGSDISDVNRTNPPLHKPGTRPFTPAPRPQIVAPAVVPPTFGSAINRCGGGAVTAPAGTRAGAAATGVRHPLPMCAVQ